MARRYFEALNLGETWVSDPFELTDADISEYAGRYDPQPMHTDRNAAARGPFRSLIAPLLQIAVLYPQLFFEAGGWGDTPVFGLGMDELRWKVVLRPGDRLTVKSEIVELRRSKTTPGNGIVRQAITITNQNQLTVFTMFTSGILTSRIGSDGDI